MVRWKLQVFECRQEDVMLNKMLVYVEPLLCYRL